MNPKLHEGVPVSIYCLVELERDLQPVSRAESDRDTAGRLGRRLFGDNKKPLENLRALYRRGRSLVQSDPDIRRIADHILDEARKRRLAFGERADPVALIFASDDLELAVLREKIAGREEVLAKADEIIAAYRELRASLEQGFSTH
jgi:hypothetical protein